MTDRYTIPTGPTADEVLYALNDCKPVRLRDIGWFVITGTHTPADEEPAWPFTPGQLLVALNGHVFPDGPALDAWHTSACIGVRDVEEAKALAEFVRAGADRGVYAWDGDRWCRCGNQQQAMSEYCSIGDGEGFAFIGDTDAANTWGRDIQYPGKYEWPTVRA
jgi:hypothetical protein